MTTGGLTWGCHLNDVILERRAEGNTHFSLNIPHLEILVSSSTGLSRLPVMGLTGSGKSSLLNLLAAIDNPTRGAVTWTFPSGESVSWGMAGPAYRDIQKLRRKFFGFAFQDNTLIPHLRVLDNLCYPLTLIGKSMKEARAQAEIGLEHILLAQENVSDLIRRFPWQLSGGQRQRIALVQSMIHQPYIFFADEPTGNLDPQTRQQVMGVLYNWVDERPWERLLVWVTHHDNDPTNADVARRLWVDSGVCSWQLLNGTQWTN